MTQPLTPLQPPFPEAVNAILESYPKQNGYLLKLFRVFARGPRFLRKGVLNLLDADSPLTLRDRELVILRVCANFGCEYEWGVHVAVFSKAAGFTPQQVAATTSKQHLDCWDPREQKFLNSIDELCSEQQLSTATSSWFFEQLSVDEQLEIYALVGNYLTISLVANVNQLELEDFAPRFHAGGIANR